MDEKYMTLLDEARRLGLTIKEDRSFKSHADGLLAGQVIGLSDRLETTAAKKCVLAEELAHYKYNVGDVLDMGDTESRRQEYRARKRACLSLVQLPDLVHAFEQGARSFWEVADCLGVTEKFLQESLAMLARTFGPSTVWESWVIAFDPFFIGRSMDDLLEFGC